jgi:hypothetical protein
MHPLKPIGLLSNNDPHIALNDWLIIKIFFGLGTNPQPFMV